jgi:cardiolipin synthase
MSLVASGDKWIGQGVKPFQMAIDDMIGEASHHLALTVFTVTDVKIVHEIEKALSRGVSVEIFHCETDPSIDKEAVAYLMRLKETHQNLVIHVISDHRLHAKVVVADSNTVLIGSANLTYSAMLDNYELGVLINDGRTAHDVLGLLGRLKD